MSKAATSGIPTEIIPEIVETYEQGKYLTAWNRTREYGEFTDWTDPLSQVIGGRLAHHLGGMRLSRLQLIKAHRQAPKLPEVSYWYGYIILEKKGPWYTWEYLKEFGPELEGANVEIQSSWYALHAQVAGQLRDFELADTWIKRAREMQSQSAWVETVQSFLLESEDRYDEALAQTEKPLAIRPWYRPAVQARGHLKAITGDEEGAVEFLKESLNHIESASVAMQAATLQNEMKDYDGAAESLAIYEQLAPLTDKHSAKWVAALKADIHYHKEEFDAAVEEAKKCGKGFYEVMAERLEKPENRTAKRVELPMKFVRQHHLTCVPATLTAMARYWEKSVDHLDVAEKICYNGTSALNERRWAVDNGWVPREFTLTEESVVALIDAGVPIGLTTAQPGNAHQQAIHGYDLRRGTLLILDPYIRKSEALTDKLLENQAAFGPRGFAMVPAEEAHRLDGIDLPDADLWDQLHDFDACLDDHRREDAICILNQLDESNPDHRITTEAHKHLAIYDGNPQEHLKWIEKQLELFPETEALAFQRLFAMRTQSHRDERLAAFRELIVKEDCHPLIKRDYAKELAEDHAHADEALFFLKQAIRQTHTDGRCYAEFATLLWDLAKENRKTAFELYRFSACLEEHDELLSEKYVVAAQHFNQIDEALRFLRKRFERHGSKSGWPAETLSQAYRRLAREQEAIAVLEEAIQKRPDDGGLLIYAADVFAAAGTQYLPQAREYLAQAKGKAPHTNWLRTAAFIGSIEGKLDECLSCWRAIVEQEPFATDAHAAITQLLAETQDIAVALEYLDGVAAQFPFNYPLQELRIMWLRDEDPERAEVALREVLDNIPDPWFVRELAHVLTERGDLDEAKRLAKRSGEMEKSVSHYHLVAAIHQRLGNMGKARGAYRKAIEQTVDNRHAIAELVDCCTTVEERREELDFIREQLRTQTLMGEGITAFRLIGQNTLEAEEVLEVLKEANQTRPDLWESWSSLTQQYADMDRLNDASRTAVEGTERFPLIPQVWLDRALVSRALGNFEDELESAQAAWQIAPYWHPVVDTLCEIHERNGDHQKARELMEQLVQSNPLEGRHQARLAEILWEGGEKEAAMDRAARAIELDPGNRQAWAMLDYWSQEQGDPDRPIDMARELTKKRPNEARSWLMLARMLEGPETLEEHHAAIDRCLELNDRCVEAYSIRAYLFANEGEEDQARRACRPKVFGENPPVELKLTLARLEADFSGPEEALSILENALKEEPEYIGGWQQLADWYRTLDDSQQFLRCAREIARIDPHNPESLGYLGEALASTETKKNKEEAVELFQRAFDLAPGYEFAGFWLFDLQMEAGNTNEAAQVLGRMKMHVEPTPLVVSRQVQLDSACKDRESAVNHFYELCLMEGDQEWAMPNAVHAMRNQDWHGHVMRTLIEAIEHENCNPEAGAAFGGLSVADGLFDEAEKRLKALSRHSHAGERAVHEYLSNLIEDNMAPKAASFIHRNAGWMRESDHLWGSIGYCYAAMLRYDDCVETLSDWRERENLEPWMLFNLVEGLRALECDDEAHEASAFAVAMEGADHTKELHRIWLCLDDPFEDPELLAHCVLNIEPDAINSSIGILHALLVATFQMAGGFGEPAPFHIVKQTVKEAIAKYAHVLKVEPAYRRFLRRYIKMLASNYSGLGPLLFSWSRFFHR